MTYQSFIVDSKANRLTIAAFLKTKLGISWSKAKHLIEQRRVKVGTRVVLDVSHRIHTGERIEVISDQSGNRTEPKKSPPKSPKKESPKPLYEGEMPKIVYVDDAIIVVDKPSGLTTMRHPEEANEFGIRGKKYLPPTLADLLPSLLSISPKSIRAVHRIDRDTSGLVVFARTLEAERKLTQQFREHSIERRYLAITRGIPAIHRVESHFIEDRGDGRRGSSSQGIGQRAVTFFYLAEDLVEFALVECRLETGRTHQVRIHLGEQGTPICGEKVYDRPIHGSPIPDGSKAKRTMLHAIHLGFHHPETQDWMEWDSPLPEDMQSLLNRLREKKAKSE